MLVPASPPSSIGLQSPNDFLDQPIAVVAARWQPQTVFVRAPSVRPVVILFHASDLSVDVQTHGFSVTEKWDMKNLGGGLPRGHRERSFREELKPLSGTVGEFFSEFGSVDCVS